LTKDNTSYKISNGHKTECTAKFLEWIFDLASVVLMYHFVWSAAIRAVVGRIWPTRGVNGL